MPCGSNFAQEKHCLVATCRGSTQHRLGSSCSSRGRMPCVASDPAVLPRLGPPAAAAPLEGGSTWYVCLNTFGTPAVSRVRMEDAEGARVCPPSCTIRPRWCTFLAAKAMAKAVNLQGIVSVTRKVWLGVDLTPDTGVFLEAPHVVMEATSLRFHHHPYFVSGASLCSWN